MNYTNRSSDRINAAIEKALAAERGDTRIDKAIEKALMAENSKSRIDKAIEKARTAENGFGSGNTATNRTSKSTATQAVESIWDRYDGTYENSQPLTKTSSGVKTQAQPDYMKPVTEAAKRLTYSLPAEAQASVGRQRSSMTGTELREVAANQAQIRKDLNTIDLYVNRGLTGTERRENYNDMARAAQRAAAQEVQQRTAGLTGTERLAPIRELEQQRKMLEAEKADMYANPGDYIWTEALTGTERREQGFDYTKRPDLGVEMAERGAKYDAKIAEIDRKLAEFRSNAYRYITYEPDFRSFSQQGAEMRQPQERSTGDPELDAYLEQIGTNAEAANKGTFVNEAEHIDVMKFLNHEENSIYNYLLAKYGQDSANIYLDTIEDELNRRKGGNIANILKSQEGMARAVQTGGYALRSGLEQWGQGVEQAFKDEVQPVTPVQYGAQYVRESLADAGPKVLGSSIGQIAFDTTQTVGNMLPSMIISMGAGAFGAPAKLAKLMGAGAMGTSAGGNTYATAVREGMDPDEAREYARLVGTAAGLLQYAIGGIDKLSGGYGAKLSAKAAGIENGFLRFIAKHGANALSEASEEALEAILDPIFREIATGDDADIDWSEVVYNTLLGGLTGWLLGGNGETEAAQGNTRLTENDLAEYSLVDKRIPTYDELVRKPDIKVVDIRDNRGKFRERQKALLNRDVSPVVNSDTGEKIFVTKKTFTHSFSNSEVERTAAAEKINDIIENAVLTHKEPSYKTGDNSTGVYTFFAAVLTDEGIKPVKLKVKEYVLSGYIPRGVNELLGSNDDTYATAYDSRVMVLDEIEKKMHPVTAATMPAKAGVNYPSASSTIRVADLLNLVNSEYRKYLPEKTDAISQGKTANGEPTAIYAARLKELGRDYSNTIYSDALKRRSIERAQDIADKQGVKLSFESLGGNIRGKYEKGVITLNSDRSDPVMEVFVHELTHHLESSGNYDSLRNAALSYIRENLGADVEAMKADVISEYAEGGIKLNDAGAERELVAQFCGEMLFADEESIIRLARADRNLAQRIYDWICDTISKLGKDADTRALIDARRMYENALRTVGDTQGESKVFAEVAGVSYSISPRFNSEFDRWLENGKPDRQQITVGTTSDALKSIGVDDKVIKWDTSKINKIQREHLGMSDGVIRQVPNIIENPILVMESKTQPNRLTMFGEVYNDNGLPVMAVLELRPTSRNNYELDQIKVANAFSRDHNDPNAGIEDTQSLISSSNILYIDPDKKRTDTWLSRNQLHLPLGIDRYGPIGSIALVSRDSQGNFSADSKVEEIPEWKKKLQSFDTQASYGSSLMERAQKLAAKTEVNGRGTDGENTLLYAANPESKEQSLTDRLLYTEALMRKAQKEGNLYTQRLLQMQIEKAMQNSSSGGIDASAPMPTIYSDRISKYNVLEDYADEIDFDDLNVDLENDANSDTISEERVKNLKLTKSGKVINPMPAEEYSKVKDILEARGVEVFAAISGDDLGYMLAMGAEGTYSNGRITHIGEVPSRGTMYEELIHMMQAKEYGELDTTDYVELYRREIEANRKLLKYSEHYKLDVFDISDIKRNLKGWEESFAKAKGISYDEFFNGN